MLPLVLDVSGRLALVVGGGAVGRRKADAVLQAGGRVRLVCLEERPAELSAAGLEWVTTPYESSHLDGSTLVFAAGPPELNRRVVADARARGLWVNAATEPEQADFYLPAVCRRGELILAVSTAGTAPALARTVRDHISEELDEAVDQWLTLVAELRRELAVQGVTGQARDAAMAAACQWDWVELIRAHGIAEAKTSMRSAIGLRGSDE